MLGYAPAEAYDFNRNRPTRSQYRNDLRLVNHNQLFGRRGQDDTLTQERSTPTLDHCKLRVDLVRAVDREVEFGILVEGCQGKPHLRQRRFGTRRGGYNLEVVQITAVESLAKRCHDKSHRRPAAESQAHPACDMFRSLGCDPMLEFLLIACRHRLAFTVIARDKRRRGAPPRTSTPHLLCTTILETATVPSATCSSPGW